MRNFQLKGWSAIGVSLIAAFGLVLGIVSLMNSGAILSVSPFGVTHYGAVHVDDGSASEPSHGFTDDTDTGLYRVGSNDIGVSIGGSKVGDFTSSGWTGPVAIGSNDLSGRNITATGTANVAGASALNGGLTMDTSAFSVADTTGNTVVSGTLTVTSTSDLVGAVTASGLINANAGIAVDTSAFTVADATGNTVVSGTLNITGAMTAQSTGSFAGNLTASAFMIHASQSITPTDGAPITPTQSLIVLTPAEAVTPTIAACSTSGVQLVLYNQEAQSIVFQDSGNFKLTGDLTLTQDDTVPLVCVGTVWVQVGPVSAN